MRATVVGAGVAGLTTALTLAERGAKVTLVERSRELGGNASWLAGGMLAPFCEGESAPPSVVELGRGAIDWWAARVPGVVREGTLVVAPPRDAAEIERFAARTSGHRARGRSAQIAALEPDLAGRFHKGLFFPGEGPSRSALGDARARRKAFAAAASTCASASTARRSVAEAGDRRRLPRLRRAARPRRAARRARRDDPRAHARDLPHAHGAAPPSALSPLCRAEGEQRIHDRRDDDREREQGRGQRALGDRAPERCLRASSGVRRGGDSRIERRRPPRLSRQRAANRGAGRAASSSTASIATASCWRRLSPIGPRRSRSRGQARRWT